MEIFTPLLDLATPDLYRANAFRILDLNPKATSRDVRKKLDKAQKMQKLGGNLPASTGVAALSPPPTEEHLREAGQRLADPLRLLLDELFWFWPLTATRDLALEALKKNKMDVAVQLWTEAAALEKNGPLAIHNLAVLYHVVALDYEFEIISTKDKEYNHQYIIKYWEDALNYWHQVQQDDVFWNLYQNRVHELDDPRVTVKDVDLIRRDLPLTILSINSRIAVHAAETSDEETMMFHLDLISQSPYDEVTRNRALRDSITPISNRIKTLCRKARSDIEKSPKKGDDYFETLFEHTKPLMEIQNRVLGLDNPTRNENQDEIVLASLECIISYGNESEDWVRTRDMMRILQPLAVSMTTQERLNRNLDVITANAADDACWFCETNPGNKKYEYEVKMHGDVQQEETYSGTNITWRHITITVPRCGRCAQAQSNRVWRSFYTGAFTGMILGACGMVGFNIYYWADISQEALTGAFLGAGVGAAAGAVLGLLFQSFFKLPAGIKPVSMMNSFPRIREQQKMGWKFGARPAAADQ